MTPERTVLLEARKEYSKCANLLESRIGRQGLTRQLSEQIIGVGVAADWVRRAGEMDEIVYIGSALNSSSRRNSFVELIRFGFSWFGLNAIFSRPTLLNVIGTPASKSEYEEFLVLY